MKTHVPYLIVIVALLGLLAYTHHRSPEPEPVDPSELELVKAELATLKKENEVLKRAQKEAPPEPADEDTGSGWISADVFTEEGDKVIVQPPVFFDFFDILRENKRSLVSNPLILEDGRYRMDFDDLERKASAPRTKMIYLCNPHNPIGRVWSENELRSLGGRN